MTKQEEIREGIRRLIDGCYNARNPDYPKLIAFQPMKFLNEIMPYLHSQGVVIKVDGELPSSPFIEESGDNNGFIVGRDFMLRAGYTAVIPLIKESK